MTASELPSHSVRLRSEVSFHAFALNCCVSEALSEEVLRAVSAAMASIANDGDDHLAILFVVRKDAFEAIAQVVEICVLRHLRLEDAWLHRRRSHATREGVVNAHAALVLRLKEVVC